MSADSPPQTTNFCAGCKERQDEIERLRRLAWEVLQRTFTEITKVDLALALEAIAGDYRPEDDS